MEMAQHFDIDSLEMLKEIMEDEFDDLIRIYLEDSDKRLPELREAETQLNAVALRELAHSFKGASSNISALPLAELCLVVETAARDNNLAVVPEAINNIDSEYQKVRQHLAEMLSPSL